MSNLKLSLACGAYDRTLALADGTVRPAGIDLSFMAMYSGELFRRQARNEVGVGADLFASGVAPNREHRETFLRYAWEQGLLERPLEVDELFIDVES